MSFSQKFKSLQCPICLADYAAYICVPKHLPNCKHTICHGCLDTLLDKGGNPCCPFKCHKGFPPDFKRVQNFQTNLALIQISDELQESKRRESLCPVHRKPKNLFCLHGEKEVCEDCVTERHKDHNVRSIMDIKNEAIVRVNFLLQKKSELTDRLLVNFHRKESSMTAFLQLVGLEFAKSKELLADKERSFRMQVEEYYDSLKSLSPEDETRLESINLLLSDLQQSQFTHSMIDALKVDFNLPQFNGDDSLQEDQEELERFKEQAMQQLKESLKPVELAVEQFCVNFKPLTGSDDAAGMGLDVNSLSKKGTVSRRPCNMNIFQGDYLKDDVLISSIDDFEDRYNWGIIQYLTIDLNDSDKLVDDKALEVLSDALSLPYKKNLNLKRLCVVLPGNKLITDRGVQQVCRLLYEEKVGSLNHSVTHLEMSFDNCTNIMDESLRLLSRTLLVLGKQLTSIELSFINCQKLTSGGLKVLSEAIIKSGAAITEMKLVFNQCKLITNEGVEAVCDVVVQNYNSLVDVNLEYSGCERVTDEGLGALSEALFVKETRLKRVSLGLAKCKRITDEGVKALRGVILQNCSDSTDIDIQLDQCKQVTESTVSLIKAEMLKSGLKCQIDV